MSRIKLNRRPRLQSAIAMFSLFAVVATTCVSVSSGQGMRSAVGKSSARLSEDQRVLHVLNRLGFGARPGDVERVRAIGVDKYIEQQLNPAKIDDSASEAKL